MTVSFEYPVVFTNGVFSPERTQFIAVLSRREPSRRHRAFFVVDEDLVKARPELIDSIRLYVRAHALRLELAADPLVLPGGEAIKNDPDAIARIHAHLHEARLDRQSFLVAIGGGALLDAAGFAAATAHRGMRLIRLPTTVLAQDDAGLSVKNGVNRFGKKNFIGAFAPPFAVVNDLDFLRTLSRRDTIAGMAEAIKAALIRDADFFSWLDGAVPALSAGRPEALRHMIVRSARIHLRHIAQGGDPFELGSARPLDFGHWAAHKLEPLSGYRLRHGEAVAIGMALDTLYSVRAGYLDPEPAERILTLLTRSGFQLWDETLALCGCDGRPAILDGLAEFREHLGGELTITLLKDVGEGFEAHAMDESLIGDAVERLQKIHAARHDMGAVELHEAADVRS
jgi:3-dehydroquinate synthase